MERGRPARMSFLTREHAPFVPNKGACSLANANVLMLMCVGRAAARPYKTACTTWDRLEAYPTPSCSNNVGQARSLSYAAVPNVRG